MSAELFIASQIFSLENLLGKVAMSTLNDRAAAEPCSESVGNLDRCADECHVGAIDMSRPRDRPRDTTPSEGAEHADDRGSDRAGFVARLHVILRQWPSADRLARAVGVSPSAFRKWLRGEAEPSRERLVALADAAGVDIGWLAKGEGQEPIFRPAAPTRTWLGDGITG